MLQTVNKIIHFFCLGSQSPELKVKHGFNRLDLCICNWCGQHFLCSSPPCRSSLNGFLLLSFKQGVRRLCGLIDPTQKQHHNIESDVVDYFSLSVNVNKVHILPVKCYLLVWCKICCLCLCL